MGVTGLSENGHQTLPIHNTRLPSLVPVWLSADSASLSTQEEQGTAPFLLVSFRLSLCWPRLTERGGGGLEDVVERGRYSYQKDILALESEEGLAGGYHNLGVARHRSISSGFLAFLIVLVEAGRERERERERKRARFVKKPFWHRNLKRVLQVYIKMFE